MTELTLRSTPDQGVCNWDINHNFWLKVSEQVKETTFKSPPPLMCLLLKVTVNTTCFILCSCWEQNRVRFYPKCSDSTTCTCIF